LLRLEFGRGLIKAGNLGGAFTMKITMFGTCVLLKKIELNKSEFELTGDAEGRTPLYEVAHKDTAANGGSGIFAAGDTVLLKPGHYENIVIDGVTYLFAEDSQVAGKVAFDAK
jgi:hypothetical protein